MINLHNSKRPWLIILLPFIVVGLGSLFYVYEFLLRVTPAAMTEALLQYFHMDLAQFGFMSAGFYYAYTPMQIPAGILLDRFGPRKLLTCAILLCAIATLGFTHTSYGIVAGLMRCLIGIGSAFAFIGPLMLARRWFSHKHFAFIAGIIQMMGCLGAMIGGWPISMLSHHIGWQSALNQTAFLGFGLTILFWWLIRDHPAQEEHIYASNDESSLSHIKSIIKHPQTWWIAFVGLASWTPIAIFAELWGVSFISKNYHISETASEIFINFLWIGVAIGSPFFGWLSNKIRKRKLPLIICFAGYSITCTLLIYTPLSPELFKWTLLLMGLFAGAQPVTFGMVNDNNPGTHVGTAIGFQNMSVIASGMICQPLVGLLINTHAIIPATTLTNYHLADFQYGLILMPVISVTALLITLYYVKETHCTPLKNNT